MKAKWISTMFCSLTLLAVAAGVVLSEHQPRTAPASMSVQHFQVNGIVRGLEADGKTILIQHEDIPGFMPAMTMPFSLRGTNGNEFASGDRVRFDLNVTKDDSWISKIEKLKTVNISVTGYATAPEEKQLEPGDIVPDVTLTDQNGKTFHLADFRGKAVLITFIYTRCALPNYCPLMSKNFSMLQEQLTREFAGRFHLISISFDSGYDTPEVMKSYAQAFTKDETSWTFASGSKQQIVSAALQFGLVYLPEAGSFTHDLRTALIGPDGKLLHVWRSNVWTPDEVESRVAEVLRQQSVLAPANDKKSSTVQRRH
jgi:protein SCO1/2